MTIGVGVEGPSDRDFWNKVLRKHFPRVRFDIRNMKNKDKLIRESARLLDAFHDSQYAAGFVLVDMDRSPCVTSMVEEFDPRVRQQARKPIEVRYFSICVAIRELEAWFLADEAAIRSLLPRVPYTVPGETGHRGAEEQLTKLRRRQHGQIAFNKIDFARRIAPKFDPKEAMNHSASFKHFWQRMARKVGSS